MLESKALLLTQSANMQSGVNAAVRSDSRPFVQIDFYNIKVTELTKHARRVYVGGLPYGVTEVEIMELFNKALMAAACSLTPGAPVISAFINQEKRFAFVELRTVAEASNALALDGIMCQNTPLSLKRPHDYNPVEAKLLGPSEPDPNLNLQLVTLVMQLIAGATNKVFIENIPAAMPEHEVTAQLSLVARLASFALVKDPETGASKGQGLAEFHNAAALEAVITQLNGTVLQGSTLVARRAALAPEAEEVLQQLVQRHQKFLIHGPALAPAAPPSQSGASAPHEVRLKNVLDARELEDAAEVEALEHDMRVEVGKYGALEEVTITRAPEDGAVKNGSDCVGDVVLKFRSAAGASRAAVALQGRLFGDAALRAELVVPNRS